MPRITYVPKSFRDSSLEVIEFANDVITDYRAQGFTLTLRQLYYRFIAADFFPNTERSYNRLGSIINDARLAGLVDWYAIEDRGRSLAGTNYFDDPADLIQGAAGGYAIDKWLGQPEYVEVWVEKQALESVIGRAAQELDCDYFSCKGYVSQSEMWRAAQRFKSYARNARRITVIHLGDHDPSGIDMTRDIRERLNDVFGAVVNVERIALNMDQIEEYGPPPNPAKVTDSRAPEYIARFGRSSWELDALEPKVLHELIIDAIEPHLDRDKYDAQTELERQQRATLEAVAEHWLDIEAEYMPDPDELDDEDDES